MEQGFRLIYGDPGIKTVYINYSSSFSYRQKNTLLDVLWNEYKDNPYLISSKKTVIRVCG
jgi:hypothetical protein